MATKTYEIKINGVVENIDAVKALNEQLKEAESRIKAINAKGFSSIKGGGGGKSELSEQERIEKQIAKNEEKIAAARTEQAKALQMQKDILKEINKEQKGQVAEGRLSKGGYSNTMAGLKSELADIKAVMNNTDLGDSAFKDLVARANELTTKLKEIEASYGTFGRNVGNYANGVAEGIVHARQELKGLKTEMQDLANKKRKGIITQDEEERLKSVVKEYNNLKSTLEDANKPMDAMMDTVQSIVAIVSAGKGIASFFGLDDNKVEESLKKLLALQNAMQGLQTIQKQMSAGDGLGKYFASMNSAIDTGTQKLLVYNRAILGTGKAAKITAVSIKALGTALKSIGIGLVIAGIVQLLDLLDKWINKGKEVTATMQAINDIVGQTGQGYAKAKANISMAQKAIDNFNGSAKEEKKLLEQLNSSTNGLVANCKNLDEAKQKIVEHAADYLEMMKLEAQAQALLSLYVQEYAKIIQKRQILSQQFSGSTFLNNMLDSVMQNEFKKADVYLDKVTDMLQQAADLRKKFFTEEKEETKNNQKDTVDSEQELQNLRIDAMKDGLNKKLIQLDEERRQTLNKLKGNQKAYLETERIFEQRRRDIIIQAREELDKKLADIQKSTIDKAYNVKEEALRNEIESLNHLLELYGRDTPTASVTPRYKIDSGTTNHLKESFDDLYLSFEKVGEKAEESYKKWQVVETDYTNKLDENLTKRVEITKHYLDALNDYQVKYIKDKYVKLKEEIDLEKEERDGANEKEWSAQSKHYDELISGYTEFIQTMEKKRDEFGQFKNKEDEKDYKTAKDNLDNAINERARAYQTYLNNDLNITNWYNNEKNKLEKEQLNETSSTYEKGYRYLIAEHRAFLSDVNAATEQQPIMNDWGIINYQKTKENYDKIKKATVDFVNEIIAAKSELPQKVVDGLITQDDADAIKAELNDIQNSVAETAVNVQQKLKDLGTEVWRGINDWLQQVGQATNSILSSLSEITSNGYEKQIDAMEKYIDKYSELLDKQRDKTQEYANAVDDIENELSDARGDRRQQLIDQLNAEMAAQRASLEQEKRLEKEKEKAEHRKAELEYQQAVARKRMDEAQALINSIMAVSMAAVNHYPIPAIPMMSLAAAVGAAQYAAVRSQYIPRPTYGDGGVIVGKSHKDGGVPVLGGRAEVEGGEFITNKVTTSKNADLLEFINSKRKKVDISDLIDFYGSGKPSKSIKGIRTKFADGGSLPLLRNDISMNDRVLQAIEDYSNRPTVVQVVDIVNQTERLNQVKVISGLEM